MEIRHADSIAMQIIALDGKPNWDFTPLEVKESVDEMMLDHIERERKIIQFYISLIDAADKEGQEQLELVIRGIEAEEEAHLAYAKGLLKKGK
ncbi:MAG: hypothetical protein ISS45_06505 [Candidatus Omnitrophica bacterium]|nr:hypothetical protein [Candidatus Omnitrophota bacterium]